ncbi:MAG: peptide chain release factor-like protein [Candidatus Peribacteraceae bacterium]|nr:peptide chain release factor-like protein [Candidatus Peribacteraceae bacterium]
MPFPVPLPPAFLAKAAELNLREEDVTEHFIRGGGHGGQKINKTASMVQLIHRPTGIEVRVQKHREQSKNRLSAWKLLILKIEERVKGQKSQLQQKIFKLRKQKMRRGRKAKEKMLREKHHHGEIKQSRRGDGGLRV